MTAITNIKFSPTYTAKILNSIVYSSYTEDIADVIQRLKDIKSFIDINYIYLYDAVLSHLFWVKSCNSIKESNIQSEFFNNIEKYLPGAKKVTVKCDKKHIPDGFVKLGNYILPVEVKVNKIVMSSILQITRYMNAYNSIGGIVVAPKLETILPNNIIFIKVNK